LARTIDPDEPLVRTAVFGKQVEDFLTSDIGDYLLQKAKHEEADAIEALVQGVGILPEREILELRNRIWTARKFQSWLGRAVEMGLQSMELLQEED